MAEGHVIIFIFSFQHMAAASVYKFINFSEHFKEVSYFIIECNI